MASAQTPLSDAKPKPAATQPAPKSEPGNAKTIGESHDPRQETSREAVTPAHVVGNAETIGHRSGANNTTAVSRAPEGSAGKDVPSR
jgi:hypothetical protein